MPNWKGWNDVPIAEQNQLLTWADEWDALTGGQLPWTQAQLLSMANAGIVSQSDFGNWMFSHGGTKNNPILASMPWAQFGLSKDAYEQLSTTYGTIYEKVTGQQISADELRKAFLTPNLAAAGMFTGSQFEQQLMTDTSIQKQFGWVRYGMDFSQWQQQKLQLKTAYGRDIQDAEAATILQYTRPSQGPIMSALGQTAQRQQQPAGESGLSVVR